MANASRFNVILPLETGAHLAFNCASCALAHIDEETYPAFRDLLEGTNGASDEFRPDLVKKMYKGSFLVDDGVDEVMRLEAISLINRFQTQNLSLTIAPTLACNFRCSYCYEQAVLGSSKMTEEVERQLVDFVQARTNRLASFAVVWYGGEPLLAKNTIFRLSEQFMTITEASDCAYEASMVSNGFLLTQSLATQLRGYRVRTVQITLDGPPHIHDSRRAGIKGTPTFNRILDNLLGIVDILQVVIRVNIDQTNQDAALDLLDILEQRGLKDKLQIYFAQVDSYDCVDDAVAKWCISDRSFSETEVVLYKMAAARGWQLNRYPRPLASYCGALSLNAFVVDPLGNLHKCWNTIGDPAEIVGHVGESVKMNPRHSQWLSVSPFKFDHCRNCRMLPICAGGCPYGLVVRAEAEPRCERWKHNLLEMLHLKYLQSPKASC
jgi:uncharacterized protein